MSTRRRVALAASLTLASLMGAPTTLAASQTTDCGQFTSFTAPDPLGPTDGSLELGPLPVWTVAATATIIPPADSVLPTIVGTGIVTCLLLDLDDDGIITSIAFATSGTVTGPVVFDSGSSSYRFADRVSIPTFVTDLYPGLRAIFETSAAAGTDLRITFGVDPVTGQFSALDARARFCGSADVNGSGDGVVGAATISADVLDADDLDALAGAGSRNTCATIDTVGTIDSGTGALTLATEVTITVAAGPTAPPTSMASSSTAATPGGGVGWVLLVLVFGSTLAIASVRLPRAERGR